MYKLLTSTTLTFTRKFGQDQSGVAAIEFAIIAPIMIGLYFGLAEIASAISVDRRVSHATNVAADLATQEAELLNDDIEEVVSAALRVLNVQDVSKVSMDIESFILPANGQPPQSRGRIRVNSSAGNFSNFNAGSLDPRILNDKSGVVVTRMSYRYTPIQMRFFDSILTLDETFLLKPRRSDAVQIGSGNGSQVNCSATSYSNVNCG